MTCFNSYYLFPQSISSLTCVISVLHSVKYISIIYWYWNNPLYHLTTSLQQKLLLDNTMIMFYFCLFKRTSITLHNDYWINLSLLSNYIETMLWYLEAKSSYLGREIQMACICKQLNIIKSFNPILFLLKQPIFDVNIH